MKKNRNERYGWVELMLFEEMSQAQTEARASPAATMSKGPPAIRGSAQSAGMPIATRRTARGISTSPTTAIRIGTANASAHNEARAPRFNLESAIAGRARGIAKLTLPCSGDAAKLGSGRRQARF